MIGFLIIKLSCELLKVSLLFFLFRHHHYHLEYVIFLARKLYNIIYGFGCRLGEEFLGFCDDIV